MRGGMGREFVFWEASTGLDTLEMRAVEGATDGEIRADGEGPAACFNGGGDVRFGACVGGITGDGLTAGGLDAPVPNDGNGGRAVLGAVGMAGGSAGLAAAFPGRGGSG